MVWSPWFPLIGLWPVAWGPLLPYCPIHTHKFMDQVSLVVKVAYYSFTGVKELKFELFCKSQKLQVRVKSWALSQNCSKPPKGHLTQGNFFCKLQCNIDDKIFSSYRSDVTDNNIYFISIYAGVQAPRWAIDEYVHRIPCYTTRVGMQGQKGHHVKNKIIYIPK